MGAFFNYSNKKPTLCRMRFVGSRGTKRFAEALFVIFVISSMSYFLPIWLTGGPRDVFESQGGAQRIFYWSDQGTACSALFQKPGNYFDQSSLVIFGIWHYFIGDWVYGLGVPSGLFLPSLLTGAAFG